MKNSWWFFLAIVFACTKQKVQVESHDFSPKEFITLDFNTAQEFVLDSVYISGFIFSPFKENHLLVFTQHDGIFDVDLKSKLWSKPIDTLYKYLYWVRPEAIHPDLHDRNKVWISNYQRGSACYHIEQKELEVFPHLRSFNAIHFDTANVWFGTWEGLYRYDRKHDSLFVVPGTANIPVTEILWQSDTEINLDGHYVYNKHFNQLDEIRGVSIVTPMSLPYPHLSVYNYNNERVTIKSNDGQDLFGFPFYSWKSILFEDNTMWVPTNELYEGIARIDVHQQNVDTIPIGYYFKVGDISGDDQHIWISNPREIMIINKQAGEARIWFLPFQSTWQIQYQDLNYVYLTGRQGVQIIPKSVVLDQSNLLTKIKKEEEAFNWMLDSTRISSTYEIRSWYAKYKLLYPRFAESISPRIQASLANIHEMTSHMVPDEYMPFDTSLFTFFDSIAYPDIKTNVVHSLMIYAVRKGHISKAIHLDQQWINDSAVVDTNDYTFRQRKAIRKANDALLALKGLDIQEDEKLWLTGNIYLELFGMVGREREVGMDLDLPFSYYSKLCTKFPMSKWADNASFLLFSSEEGLSHEGGDNQSNPEFIKGYKEFIQKYPGSELIPDAYLRIAQLYFDFHDDEANREKYVKGAKLYLDKLKSEFPLHPLVAEADLMMEYVIRDIDALDWILTISSNKFSYALDEPVLITYQLVNGSKRPLSIRLNKDNRFSNFYHYIIYGSSYPNPVFQHLPLEIHTQTLDKTVIDTILKPGETYMEVKDITQWAKAKAYGPQGYYPMDLLVEYKIEAFIDINSFKVSSNQITITRK